MKTVTVDTVVSADGILRVDLPAAYAGHKATVVVTVDDAASVEDRLRAISGSWKDIPFERLPQDDELRSI